MLDVVHITKVSDKPGFGDIDADQRWPSVMSSFTGSISDNLGTSFNTRVDVLEAILLYERNTSYTLMSSNIMQDYG